MSEVAADRPQVRGDELRWYAAGGGFSRAITFDPAYDYRDHPRWSGYGRHGVTMTCYVKGVGGAVQFKLFTDWGPWLQRRTFGLSECHPMAADLGYHSLEPRYEGQEPMTDTCEILDGCRCYYDGSGLNAEGAFTVLMDKGGEGLWRLLERYYHNTFEAGGAV